MRHDAVTQDKPTQDKPTQDNPVSEANHEAVTDPDGLTRMAEEARVAQRILATSSGAVRVQLLEAIAEVLEADRAKILTANRLDLDGARNLTTAQRDRLTLDESRVGAMVDSVRAISRQRDVVGEVVEGWVLANGLRVRRIRVPLGVVGVIYENRPNVTSDASALALYAGNAILLRGSSQARHSNQAIVAAIRQALAEIGLPVQLVGLAAETSREGAVAFMRLGTAMDVLIPRGGPELIATVRAQATVPTIIDGDGNCHVYVDEGADLAMAVTIIENAKMQRPGVCNAMETLLIHASVAESLLGRLDTALAPVELRGDARTLQACRRAVAATEDDYAREFLDLILAVRVVDSLDEAIDHIRKYSSGHSEAIITSNLAHAQRFEREVDAASVLVNASTRFVDGGQLGMGAEIGISTQKLHARGPMGITQLTTTKIVIEGEGQIRH
ncbi:glutamate-5-semialdehyde dehydrogenase [Ferrimicrobium sp.]|uniref:glutamate-5-semialdehyde dehydrogenase n=1 Tax=Ferrimicrobium sp. TaxID=2926050 RepID=UPI00260F8362|nr:glutamate-5-semialdehyde dehydrogenase [Ferrimicrobium sp.]